MEERSGNLFGPFTENRMSTLDKSSPFLGDTGERVAELEFFGCRSLLTLTLPQIHTKTNLVDIIKHSALDHRDEGPWNLVECVGVELLAGGEVELSGRPLATLRAGTRTRDTKTILTIKDKNNN